jgi:putative ABC transport system permease protein
VWVAQKGSDNILKSSSFLPTAAAEEISEIEGVAVASPLVRIISKADIGGRLSPTLFLFGFDPETKLGAPATVVEGTAELEPNEIVVDQAFARKYALAIGHSITIQNRKFKVAGISQGTNALVSQFGFLRFDDGEAVLGLPGISSFVLLRVNGDRAAVVKRINEKFPELTAYDADDFASHHEEEMDSVLPIFAAAALFGAAVGGFIVALMLYSSALERRDDYATLKALGAGQRHLVRLVIGQSLLITLAGSIAGALFTIALTPFLVRLVPTLALRYSPALLLVFPAALLIGAAAATAPLRVLKRIFPGEVFRA